MANERRDTARFSFSLEAELGMSGHASRTCRIRDLSHGGAFVLTSAPPAPSTHPVELIMHVHRAGHMHRVRYQAMVMRQANDGIGVFFCGIGAPDYVPLVDLVMLRASGRSRADRRS